MKTKIVLTFEKQPMEGIINTRCEQPLATFYAAYAALRGTDPAEVHREALRSAAKTIARKHPRLRKYARELTCGL